MENTKENAENFLWKYEEKNSPDWLSGVPDLVNFLVEYGEQLENQLIPNDVHSFEVFAIKDSDDSSTGKQAFIGFKLKNENFEYIQLPYTESIKIKQNWFYKIFKKLLFKINNN